MAFYDQVWYVNFGNGSSTGYYAVTVRPQNAAVAAGVIRRQFTAPAVGSERCFVCIVAGTTANVTDATWGVTRGFKTTDGTVTWQECTGIAAVNGDAINTINWTQAKAIGAPTLGTIIKRNSGASYQICSTQGSMAASEPSFSDTAGVTTNDGTTVWTSLGPVGNFTGGGAPFPRLERACATNWFAAGNTIYVGNNHAESQTTAITPAPATSAATMGKIICHNSAGSYPPAAGDITTGATISTTAAVSITFTIGGGFYIYGLTVRVGVGQSTSNSINLSTSNGWVFVDNCIFDIANTGGGSLSVGAGSYGTVIFNNTTVKFTNTAQKVTITNSQFVWQNTGQVLVSGSLVPVTFLAPSTVASPIVLEALDLSQLTGSICANGATITNFLLKDCKLNASATVDVPTVPGTTMQLVRSDSAATAYKSTRIAYEGSETTETAITRAGGSVDPTGQAQSRKIVTSVNVQWLRPFKAEPYAIWNAVTAANVVVTVDGTINAGALPNNDDIWLEVEYLGSSAAPVGTIVTTTKSNLFAANAAVASDGSNWNGVPTAPSFDGTNTLVVLSNGNLTVTHNNNSVNAGAISRAFLGAGKYYFEVTIQTSTSTANFAGIMSSAFAGVFGTPIMGSDSTSVNMGVASTITSNGTTAAALGTTAVGDVFCFAIDLTARLAWIRRNGGNWNADGSANPATGVGGVTVAPTLAFTPIVRFASGGTSTDAMTANFGASAYAFTAPAGFGNWLTGWFPFKLAATLSSPQPGLAGYIHARVRVAKPSTTFYIDPQVVLS